MVNLGGLLPVILPFDVAIHLQLSLVLAEALTAPPEDQAAQLAKMLWLTLQIKQDEGFPLAADDGQADTHATTHTSVHDRRESNTRSAAPSPAPPYYRA
jgi:hypothetical protein